MEPISCFAVLLKTKTARVVHPDGGLVRISFGGPVKNDKGADCYIYQLGIDRATTPGYPFRIKVIDEVPISVQGVFHVVGEGKYKKIPIVVVLPDSEFHFGRDVEIDLDRVLRPGISSEEQLHEVEKAIGGSIKTRN